MNHINSPLNVEVTYYLNLKEVFGVKKNLLDILYAMLEENEVSREIIRLRLSDNRNLLQVKKKSLPCFIPSGFFAKRNLANLVSHSNLIQFDIDFKDNQHIENFHEIKEELKKNRNIAYIGLSVSGKGFWGLIPIKYADKHKEHFRYIERGFASWGIKLDQSGSDVTRLRIVSFDPEPYFNHQAIPLEKYDILESPIFKQVPIQSDSKSLLLIDAMIRLICKHRIDITDGYANWFKLCCFFSNLSNGRTYFHQISRFHREYKISDTDRQFNRCLKLKSKIGISYFLATCKQYGITHVPGQMVVWKDEYEMI